MSLFGVLGNARGQRSLASRVVPRRRVKRLPAERLAAARLTGILLLLDDASPPAVRRQLDAADPQHVSAARQPRHARELPIAPSVTDDVSSANRDLSPEVPAPEVLESEVLASEVPGAGRHRRPGVPAAVIPAREIPAREIPAREMPAHEISGTGRHRRPGVPADVDWAHPIPASVLSRPAVPGAGHHRRAGVRAFMALRGVRVAPPRVVLLGLLVLLVAFAAVLGVRGSATLESAQPHADAATSHSATVIVPGTR
jgi:hypothetical protein